MVRVLNYGSLNIDYVYSVPHIVRPGETISAMALDTFPGGKGLNQSVALARAGANVCHGGKVGANGGFLLEILKENHVDCSFLLESDGPNGSAMIQRDQNGQNSIICYAGSNGEITKEEIDRALEGFSEGDVLVSQNEISHVPYLIEQAGKRGMKIAFNPSPIDDRIRGMDLTPVTWLIINEVEGYELTHEKEPEQIITKLLKQYPQMSVILTLGEDGAVFCNKEKKIVQKAYTVNVKDTTAAGDTFLGYFVGSTVTGESVETALDRAASASAIAVGREGAVPSIPHLRELGQ